MSPAGPALRDIHLPAAAWWPLAPAWWVALGLVLAVVATLLVWRVLRRSRRVLRATLREIDELQAAQQREPDAARLAAQASQLLRRVARRVEPAAASVDGREWCNFVLGYARTPAARVALQRLLEERYRRTPALDGAVLLPALRLWCRTALAGRQRKVKPSDQPARVPA